MTYMSMQWGNRRWLRVSAFISIGVMALYLGLLSPLHRAVPQKQVAEYTQLAPSSSSPIADARRQMEYKLTNGASGVVNGVVSGVSGNVPAQLLFNNNVAADRMIIRNGSLVLVVGHPTESVDDIIRIAQLHGGYVVSSQVSGQKEHESGQVTIRIPAAQFDTVRAELKKIAKTVDSEQISADDVTMQYSEDEATLRNYRAEESSYLEIMKRSGRIKDTLEVAEQLSDVRGRIERMAASLRTMEHQSEMTALTVSLHTEPMVVTNEWRPLYELRVAWNEGTAALADYATTMMAVLLRLPAVLAWIITLACGAKIAWMLLRVGSRMFRTAKPEPTVS